LIAVLLDVVDLNLLLRMHASCHTQDDTVCQQVNLPRNIDETPRNVHYPNKQACAGDDAIITSRVLFVEARLNHKPVAAHGKPGTAADLRAKAGAVLRLTQEIAATEPTAEPSAADVRLAGQIKQLAALLVCRARNAAAAVAERERSLTRGLEHLCLPVALTGLRQLLLHRHVD